MGTVAAPNSKLPQEILDLRAQLSSSDNTVRLDAAASVAGLPRWADCPRPGVAASWGIDEWIQWGKPFGFVRGEDGADTQLIVHEHFPMVRMTRSCTSKEYRAGMNCAADLRRALSSALEAVAVTLTTVIDAVLAGREFQGRTYTLGDDPAECIAVLRGVVQSPAVQQCMVRITNTATVTNADREAWAAIPKMLRVLENEFSITPRAAFTQIGMGDVAEKMAFVIKSPTNTTVVPRSALVLMELRGLLEAQRDLRKAAQEQKAAERMALRAQREAKRDVASQAKYDEDIKKARAQLKTGFASAHTMCTSMLKLIERQMNYVDEVPMPPYPGAPVELMEARDAAMAERDNMELERDALKDRVESDRTTINRLEQRVIELEKAGGMSSPVRAAAEELAATVITRLNTTDIGQILSAIKDCRAKAQAFKDSLTNSTGA